ncbi:hypothetical protein F5148DRAFT_1293145 [Russula earlei]|uniref:Uncharacterized protein n=1 Tax=Russula earlei TaxID=71964 RepID=A0ACC0TTI4_9AGAM|nr:hypothetical protein F5148DRAFT_1293145 [Russula earlei]
MSSFSSSSSPTASAVEGAVSVNQLAWQAPVFLVVVLGTVIIVTRHSVTRVIAAIIAGVILLIWNDDWVTSIHQRLAMLLVVPKPEVLLSPASALVRTMLRNLPTSLLPPAFRRRTLRQATAAAPPNLGSDAPRSQPVLPRFISPPDFREHELVAVTVTVPCPSAYCTVQGDRPPHRTPDLRVV